MFAVGCSAETYPYKIFVKRRFADFPDIIDENAIQQAGFKKNIHEGRFFLKKIIYLALNQ
jgi:hypothetical protein